MYVVHVALSFLYCNHNIHGLGPKKTPELVCYIAVQFVSWQACCGSESVRIRIFWSDPDPDFLGANLDPDPRLQNLHFNNIFSVEKYCE
jgi:hypothetical protein